VLLLYILNQGEKILNYTTNVNAVSIGSSNLYQPYYACLTETPTNTIIEYGKTQGNVKFGDNYLTTIDRSNPINARFYTFGNGEDIATIMDIQVRARSGLVQQCKGSTMHDAVGRFCVKKPCHKACDEMTGMFIATCFHFIPGEKTSKRNKIVSVSVRVRILIFRAD
jgi:hypothetical protein